MKKAIKIIPIAITIIAFIVLAIVILYPNFKNVDSSSKNTQGQVFATSISVNVDTIALKLGTCIRFSENPYSIYPSDCNQEVKVEILDSKNNVTSNASFANNYFSPNQTGVYYLRFFVAKNSKSYVKDNIKITVTETVDSNSLRVEILKYSTTIYENEMFDLNNMVKFINTDNKLFRCNGNEIENGMLSISESGTYTVEAIILQDKYEIITNLNIIVKEAEKVKFFVQDAFGTTINDGDTLTIAKNDSELLHVYEEFVSAQNFYAYSLNEEIVVISTQIKPLLVLKAKSVGMSQIIITNPSTQNTMIIYIQVV